MRIQAAWRGHVARCTSVVSALGVSWTRVLVYRVCEQLPDRALAKAFIKARNRRIAMLRQEIERRQGITYYLYRQGLHDELGRHRDHPRHRLRGALFIQAWWRGCRARGWQGRGMRSFEAKRTTDGHWTDGFPDLNEVTNTITAPFNFFGNALGLTDDYGRHEGECYPKTKVKRISPPQGRMLQSPPERDVLIFYSDTGGGHRASALALEAALKRYSGGKVKTGLVDIIRRVSVWPFRYTPEAYAALGNFPTIYKSIWEVDAGSSSFRDTKTFQMLWYWNREPFLAYMAETIVSGVDMIVSVHPLINHLLAEALEEIYNGAPITMPFVTIITDLGSAHLSWFEPRVVGLFVPNDILRSLALSYKVPAGHIFTCGLPVREGFWEEDTVPKKTLQKSLGLEPLDQPGVVLLMGGGEGFGRVFEVAVAIGECLAVNGFGQLVVICGRNADVKSQLDAHPWESFGRDRPRPLILGFVSNVHDYMAASDILVTKAGPGSIAEAMIKGLPCLLTSFVPGQEEGNISIVREGRAGEYVSDQYPNSVADTVRGWLQDPEYIAEMSANARRMGRPRASLDIARRMCQGFLDLDMEDAEHGIHCGLSVQASDHGKAAVGDAAASAGNPAGSAFLGQATALNEPPKSSSASGVGIRVHRQNP